MHKVGSDLVVAGAAAADNDLIIDVQNVSKTYHIWNSPTARLAALGLNAAARMLPARSALGQRMRGAARSRYRDFTALREVSFQMRRGESVGIIGRNGSGKSTLLQIIVGTLKPTQGRVAVRGRVAALLELGSAFLPDYTGRENVYLNGAVLGFERDRMDALFDQITAFADIGDFIDQPVKVYSSGMMLRLAFSVQVAVQPDILIVDEALAVGDAYFQAKCMRRIRLMLDTGTTLLFVSHSMSAVREVCSRGILLQSGRVVIDSTSGEAAQRYLSQELIRNGQVFGDIEESSATSAASDDLASVEEPASVLPTLQRMDNLMQGAETFARKAASERIQNGKAQFVNVQLLSANGELADVFTFGETTTCRMVVDVLKPLPALWIGFHVRTVSGIDAVHVDSNLAGRLDYRFVAGRRYVIDWPLELRLQHGPYYVMCALAIPDALDTMQPIYEYVDVVNHAFDFAVSPRFGGMIGGLVAPHSRCEIVELGPCDHLFHDRGTVSA